MVSSSSQNKENNKREEHGNETLEKEYETQQYTNGVELGLAGRMPRRGARRVKTRTHVPSDGTKKTLSARQAARALLAPVDGKSKKSKNVDNDSRPTRPEDAKNVPRSIVVRHGRTGRHLSELVDDLRLVMSPYTALSLRERRSAVLKDYVMAAGPLGVSHLLVVSQATSTPSLRIARLPQGPTLTFRVERYSLSHAIRASQRRSYDHSASLMHAPLVVLNNFEASTMASQRHLKVVSLAFQSMFPAINVKSVRLADCKRVLLLHLNEEDETIEVRHFMIRTKPRGITRQVKGILRSKLPNMADAQDISEVIEMQAAYPTSESEFEDEEACVDVDPTAKIEAARKKGRPSKRVTSNKDDKQSVVRLAEIGPRMTLELLKIEDGVFSGEVQYHKYKERSQDEIAELRQRHEERKRVKEERKAIQDANVERKRKQQEDKLARRQEKRKRKEEEAEQAAEAELQKKSKHNTDKDVAAKRGAKPAPKKSA